MRTGIYKQFAMLLIIAATFAGSLAFAADLESGKSKSVACAGCHGNNGKSSVPIYPHLAGQQQAYLEKQLRDFRDGKRKDPVMGPMASGLSDDDIADLAKFYAAQAQ